MQLSNISFRCLLALLYLLVFNVVKGQVVADFTTDIRQGCSPLVVNNFVNLSSGNPINYFWDFGNGNTSTLKNPGTIYFDPGSYTVKLVVEDISGRKDSVSKSNFIIVNKIPEVNFTVNNNAGCVPFTVQFSDISNGGSGTISNWQWDFGDGTTASDKSPTHTFNTNGDFTITLKASDNIGCGDVKIKSSFINVLNLPKASFTSNAAVSCYLPTLVNFKNTSSGGSISKTIWNFGDGASSSNTDASHIYTTAGTYQVTLIVTNQNGCVDSITQSYVVKSASTGFIAPENICQGAIANFVNTSSPILSAFWDFGDNTSSTDTNPLKRFATAGSFVVKLVNDFGACKDSITKSITVLPKPVADFSFVAPAAGCKLPVDVSFISTGSSATSYFWNFGDRTTSALTNPTHAYTTYGSFAAKLIVTGANGCLDSITKANVVTIVPVKINKFNGLPYKGCVPRQQAFSANITSPEPVISYLWSFGDGNTSTIAAPTYVYTTEGSYNVSLQITTQNGCTDNLVLPAAITISNKPAAAFAATPRIACASDSIQFTDLSTGNVDSRKWDFGDGKLSNTTNALHRYSDTGFFTVKLIAGNLSCYDTLTIKNYIYINPPVAKFIVQYNCNVPFSRSFLNRSILSQTNLWIFGDGTETTDINPVHIYASPGIYIVHLHVTNATCYDDFTDTIKVIDEHPDFSLNRTELCRNNTSIFTATNINLQNIASYTWNFGDNTPILTRTSSSVNHNYVRPGIYSPALTIKDILGCTRQVQHPASITILGPKADFDNPKGACLTNTVIFTDRSQPSANHSITSWIFNYGDGTADTLNSAAFSHLYSVPKTYNLSLIVKDDYGCKDTLFKPNAITITNTRASFSLSDSIFCNNAVIKFINQSSGSRLTYLWNFGDGVTDSIASPVHTFLAEGTYSISLVIKDTVGCIDSLKKVNVLAVKNARASFAVDDSVISCPPAQINFANNSTNYASVKWDFDDGNFSNIVSPSHYFLTSRTYHVKLITYGHGTCADTTAKDIIVKGPRGSFTYSPVFKCAPAIVNFTEDATNYNKNFTWDFGDGTTTTSSESTISHVYKTIGKFLPKLFLIDTSLNCRVSIFGADTITASAASSYIKAPQHLFCDSAGIQFFDSSIVQYDSVASYLWTFGDDVISNNRNPYHQYVSPGIYNVRLIIKTNGGCSDSSVTTSVKVVKSPQIQVAGASATCVNQPVTFSCALLQDTSAIQWKWDFGNGNRYFLASPPAQTYTLAGNYSVTATVTNSSGCIKKDTKVVTVNPLPDVNAGPDSVICRGQTITLQATGADKYNWQNSTTLSCTACSSPVASPVDTSLYYFVTGINSVTACQKNDTVKIKVIQPFKLLGMITDTLCAGQSVQLSVTGADIYTWSPSAGLSNANIANPVAKPDTTTLYTVSAHDYRNCFSDIASVPITVYPIPVFNIIEDQLTIATGNSVTLKTTNSRDITNWQWFPVTGLSCNSCPEPIAKPANTIVYKAVATNKGGCRTEDQVTVNVFCNNGNVFIPNTFSPNNDGSNDVFLPRGKGIALVRNFQVFSRTGTMVFQKSNFSINDSRSGWDGTYNGKPVEQGVFIYQIEVTCESGQIFSLKGDVTLIR